MDKNSNNENTISNSDYFKKTDTDTYRFKMHTVNRLITILSTVLGVVIGIIMVSGYKYSVFMVMGGLIVIFAINDKLLKWNANRYFKKIDEL